MKIPCRIRCPEGLLDMLVSELAADPRVESPITHAGLWLYYSVETGKLPDVEDLPPGDVQSYLARLHSRLERVISTHQRAPRC